MRDISFQVAAMKNLKNAIEGAKNNFAQFENVLKRHLRHAESIIFQFLNRKHEIKDSLKVFTVQYTHQVKLFKQSEKI